MTVEVEACVKRVIYENGDFAIVAFSSPRSGEFSGKGTHKNVMTLGAHVRMMGDWGEYKGRPQFAWKTCVEYCPPTVSGVSKYLEKQCEGIGPVISLKIVGKYGAENAIQALKDSPQAVANSIKGLTVEKAEAASGRLKSIEKFEGITLMVFDLIDGIGFPKTMVDSLVDRFGVEAYDMVSENPFVILDKGFKGCGFKLVDKLWMKLEKPMDSPIRQRHALRYVIERQDSVWVSVSDCYSRMGAELTGVNPDMKIAFNAANDANEVNMLKTKSGLFMSLTEEDVNEKLIANVIVRKLGVL